MKAFFICLFLVATSVSSVFAELSEEEAKFTKVSITPSVIQGYVKVAYTGQSNVAVKIIITTAERTKVRRHSEGTWAMITTLKGSTSYVNFEVRSRETGNLIFQSTYSYANP